MQFTTGELVHTHGYKIRWFYLANIQLDPIPLIAAGTALAGGTRPSGVGDGAPASHAPAVPVCAPCSPPPPAPFSPQKEAKRYFQKSPILEKNLNK